ncbi:MAG: 2,4-diaminopentanoate dehydrogenase [Halanaerobium sp.]|nr:2,4-diaminopentanoate dehydrogenase [Halanaerobium sp.]
MKKIRVIIWGLGSMGSGMAKMIEEKPGLEIVGAIDVDPIKAGKDLGLVLGLDKKMGVTVSNNPAEVLQGEAEVALVATSSFTKEVFPQLKQACEAGLNVISIAEEMAFPRVREPHLAERLDQIARENGVTILGTGINPGFVLDILIITMAGVCSEVNKIRAARINDLSPFGPTVMKTQGVGTTVEEFETGVEQGTIVGHVGFPESINMIAESLGWELDEIREVREPIISKTFRETSHVKVEPGMVAGCKHTAYGIKDGETVIILEHPQQIHPQKEGVATGDFIEIVGIPPIKMKISPEIPGGIGTMAIAVNMIAKVCQAKPGLKSMKDLPVPSPVMGDIKKMVD